MANGEIQRAGLAGRFCQKVNYITSGKAIYYAARTKNS